MTLHTEPHPLAGQTVKLAAHIEGLEPGAQYRVEDWWTRVGGAWTAANPAVLAYGLRLRAASYCVLGMLVDDEVLYGKIDGFGYLVHVSEIEAPDA